MTMKEVRRKQQRRTKAFLCIPISNCIISRITRFVYSLGGMVGYFCIIFASLVSQVVREDPNGTEEGDHHDGDQTIQDVVATIYGDHVVAAVHQVTEEHG